MAQAGTHKRYMKLIILKCLVLGFLLAFTGYGEPQEQPAKSVTWKIDNLKKIGGHAGIVAVNRC